MKKQKGKYNNESDVKPKFIKPQAIKLCNYCFKPPINIIS